MYRGVTLTKFTRSQIPPPPKFFGGGVPKPIPIPGVKNIIAVASAKGGVGKSTTADIYGPSIPILMNLRGDDKPSVAEDNKIIPLVNYGIKCMSMGFLVKEEAAIVWRGLRVMQAIDQLIWQVQWGELDALVVDLPPGTGDAQLTLCQKVPVSGAVIVSTPQDVALMDVVRGVNMFKKVNVPVLGIIENMSHYHCPNCSHNSYIFGSGGAKQTATKMGVPFLGDVPLEISIREASDVGKPIVVSQPQSTSARIYNSIATSILEQLTGF